MRNRLISRISSGVVALGVGVMLSQAAAPASPQGAITAKYFRDIGGGTVVADLTSNAKFPNSPDALAYPGYFELNAGGDISVPATSDVYNNYGAQIVGYFFPPTSGDYVFYLSADDGANLYLSTDSDPANKKLIAQEAGWSNVRSYTAIGGGSTIEAKSSQTFTGAEWPTKDATFGGAKITLQANRPYYIEALVKEGGGGDNLSVAVADPNGAIDSSSPIPGQYLATIDKTAGPVKVVTPPQGLNLAEGSAAVFKVGYDGTPPYTFQWRRDGADIPDATNDTYTIARVARGDNGAKFTVVLSGAQGAAVTSSEAVLTVNFDAAPPTLVSAAGAPSFDYITVVFSEPMDKASAETVSNYSLSGGVTISAASLAAAPGDHVLTLTTSKQAEGAQLTLTVNNVKDLAGNTIAASSKLDFMAAKFAVGYASYQRWHNESGDPGDINTFVTSIADGSIRAPDFSAAVTQFGGPWGARDNYSSRIFGFFIPPSNGNYVFFVASDDQSNLYLSTDDQPANKKLIAQEAGWSNQYQWQTIGGGSVASDKRSDTFSSPEWPTGNTITLQANKRYYIELLQDEGGGGDGSDVTFVKEGEPDPAQSASGVFMKGGVIATFLDPNGASVNITKQPASATTVENRTLTLSVTATGTSAYGTTVSYQWQKAAPGTTTFVDIAGANADTYITPALQLADSGTQFRVNVGVPTLTVPSAAATVTVNKDTTAPKITKVKASSVQNLIVTFDEPLDKATAETAGNYALSDGVTISKAILSGSAVLLETSGLTVKKSYVLTAGGVKDLFGNALAANTTFSFTANVITYADVILQDGPIGFYRFEETTGQKTKNYGTAGESADGLYMTGAGPDDSVPAAAAVAAGPRPGGFLGFDPANMAVEMKGIETQLWVDTQKQFLNNLKAFTLEYWVKPANRASDPTTFGNRIGLVGQNDAVEYGFISPNTIQIWTAGGGSLDTGYSFPDNEWHHIATIADGTSIKNYFDGQLVGTGGTTTSSYGSSTFNVHIGGGGVYDATGNFFTGQFDEVAIFDKAIPAERVLAHYRAGKEGGEAPDEGVPAGAKIAWISFHAADSTPAADAATAGFTEAPDVRYTKLLAANGHTVTRFVTTGTPDVATLNTFDLVIISRSVPSGDYQDPPETLAWNGLKAPTMILGGYIMRNSRLGYTTGATIPDTANPIKLSVKDPLHPVFAGIKIGTDGVTLNTYANIVTYNDIVQRGISVNTDPLAGGGVVLATVSAEGDPANGGMIIAEWQAGAKMANGAGDTLGGHRMVFLTGSREQTITSQAAGIYDLTEDGSFMFLNAVKYMAKPVAAAPKISAITLGADGKITLTWDGDGTLQAAESITGPWQDVAGATSPYVLSPTSKMMFGRLKK